MHRLKMFLLASRVRGSVAGSIINIGKMAKKTISLAAEVDELRKKLLLVSGHFRKLSLERLSELGQCCDNPA